MTFLCFPESRSSSILLRCGLLLQSWPTVSVGGIPVKLVDTAGIRRALDEAESIGIRKSMEALADADMVLVVLDASQPLSSEDEELLERSEEHTSELVE